MNKNDRRSFPRTATQCPVLYRQNQHSRWMVAIMIDMSATGLRMMCKEAISPGTNLEIEYKPGKNRLVPAITATGSVLRSVRIDEEKYEVSCKLTRVQF